MDNLTHSLFALTLARTPLDRAGRGGTAALLIGSNAPDVDALATLSGALGYLEWHRGPTHGPLGIVVLGVASAVIVWTWRRVWRRTEEQSAPFQTLAGLATIGVFLHVLMDLPTSYGTRVLSPFDWRWFTLDWMPIVDIYLLAILASTLIFGRAPAARRRNATIALVFMALLYGVRATAHERALAVSARAFGPRLPAACAGARPGALISHWPPSATTEDAGGRCLMDLAAIPTFVSPFDWQVIAQTPNGYDLHTISVLDGRLRARAPEPVALWRLVRHVPNRWTTWAHAGADTPAVRTFLGFSRFPAVRTTTDREGTTVVNWTDLRFDPGQRRTPNPRSNLFTATVRFAVDGTLRSSGLGR